MAPLSATATSVIYEFEEVPKIPNHIDNQPLKNDKLEIVWRNVVIFSFVHIIGIYGIYLAFTSAKLLTSLQGTFF